MYVQQNRFHASTPVVAARLVMLALLLISSLPGYSSEYGSGRHRPGVAFGPIRHVEVAEDHTRFSFDEAPVFDDGMPKAGNAFVTHGYIYRKGFFDNYDEGVDEQGQPVRPDLVIGEWTCRGYFVGDGANTKTGPWVISTQTFDFYDWPGYHENQDRQFGKRMVTTEGYELVDVDKIVKRPITGGTGPYGSARGEHRQSSLGLGQFGGIKARHTLNTRRC
ncbi:MAG: hypothetical protein WBG92_07435 [Thiohalocapsa sp.]